MTGAFEILSIDLEKKRIGVALLPEGSARAGGTAPSQPEIVAGARLTGKVERHEKFGVFGFLAPGRKIRRASCRGSVRVDGGIRDASVTGVQTCALPI